MEVYKERSRARTVFGRSLVAAVVGALAFMAAPKAADALTLEFEDLDRGNLVAVSDGDDLDRSDERGVIAVAALRLSDNFTIDVATARSNALTGQLPARLNVNLTAFARNEGRLRVRAWDDFDVGVAGNLPAFFATSATLTDGSRALSEAFVDDYKIGSFMFTDPANRGMRSTTVALGETFRIYQEFTIYARPGSSTNIDGFVEVIPVPAALPLMLGGIGMLGFLGWRRKAA